MDITKPVSVHKSVYISKRILKK